MQKNLSMFQNCKEQKTQQLDVQYDFKSRANTAQIDFKKTEQYVQPTQMKKYYHNNHINIDLKTNESFFSPKCQKYKIFDFDQIIYENYGSINSNLQNIRHKQSEFRIPKDQQLNQNICNQNMKSQKNLRIQIFDQPKERNQSINNIKAPTEIKIQTKEIKKQEKKQTQKSSQSPEIRPQTNIGRQRAQPTLSTLPAKLPLISNQNSAPLSIQSTKHANQIKNVYQLQNMHKNVGFIISNIKTNKPKEVEIKPEITLENSDNKENRYFQDDKKKTLFNIVFNSKRDLKNNSNQNNINFQTNLDKEFLNMFVLDF